MIGTCETCERAGRVLEVRPNPLKEQTFKVCPECKLEHWDTRYDAPPRASSGPSATQTRLDRSEVARGGYTMVRRPDGNYEALITTYKQRTENVEPSKP